MAKPEKVFRLGLISASVFCNEVSAGENDGRRIIRSATLSRRYKDGDEWKSSTAFGLADLPVAIRVLELALHHVESKEAEVKTGGQ